MQSIGPVLKWVLRLHNRRISANLRNGDRVPAIKEMICELAKGDRVEIVSCRPRDLSDQGQCGCVLFVWGVNEIEMDINHMLRRNTEQL